MSMDISISLRTVYETDGSFGDTFYEVEATEDEFIQNLQISRAADLVVLRDALSDFIDRNGLQPLTPNPAQQ